MKNFLLTISLLLFVFTISYAQMTRKEALKKIEILEASKEPTQGPKTWTCPHCGKYTAIYTCYQLSGPFAGSGVYNQIQPGTVGTFNAVYDCKSCGYLTLYKSTFHPSGHIDNVTLYQGPKSNSKN